MTAAALLHPDVPPEAVKPFQELNPKLEIRADLSCAASFQAAVIFGGDGTLHRYLPELHEHRIPVLIVPAGSGNDFARALGIRNVRTALRAWQQFCAGGKNVRAIDLGVIRSGGRTTLFCCVAGAGLDSAANGRANRMPFWLRARGGYLLAAVWSLVRAHMAMITVRWQESLPAGVRRGQGPVPAWLVAVGNAHRYGSGLKIVPHAKLDDGLLDVCLVAQMSRLRLLCALPAVFRGAHVRLKQVGYCQSKSVRVESAPPLEVYADGEPVCWTPAEFEVISSALRVIVPV